MSHDQTDSNPSTRHVSAWLADEEDDTRGGARRGKLYELVILGELIGGPHHGYLLRDIIGKIFGPFRQISWGALYPLIHRLEQRELIAPEISDMASHGKRGQRNLYKITRAGRDRFHTLMLEAVPYATYDSDCFTAKLGYFDHITSEHQRAILQHHQGYLRATADYLQTNLRRVMANEGIPERERMRIQWVVEFRLSRIQAEIAWVDTAIFMGYAAFYEDPGTGG
jgi:DNA-binding PadR family transcriptional regulator